MSSIEFEAELHGEPTLAIPPEIVERLPKSGRVTVLLLMPDDEEDDQWRAPPMSNSCGMMGLKMRSMTDINEIWRYLHLPISIHIRRNQQATSVAGSI